MNELEAQLIKHEGEKLRLYRCSAGMLTIGVGRNIEDRGISREESRFMLQNDLAECLTDLPDIFDGFYEFGNARLIALTDMRFNLGATRFRTFQKMIAAVKANDWEEAARQARDSKWAKQVQPERVDTIIRQLREGV